MIHRFPRLLVTIATKSLCAVLAEIRMIGGRRFVAPKSKRVDYVRFSILTYLFDRGGSFSRWLYVSKFGQKHGLAHDYPDDGQTAVLRGTARNSVEDGSRWYPGTKATSWLESEGFTCYLTGANGQTIYATRTDKFRPGRRNAGWWFARWIRRGRGVYGDAREVTHGITATVIF